MCVCVAGWGVLRVAFPSRYDRRLLIANRCRAALGQDPRPDHVDKDPPGQSLPGCGGAQLSGLVLSRGACGATVE